MTTANATTDTRLQSLMDKMAKLQGQIDEEKQKGEAEKAINTIGADLAAFIAGKAKTAKLDVKVLNGKFFALAVSEQGALTVTLATKATSTKATSTSTSTSTNGANSDFEYFLKDGRGPFADIQAAMDAMGVEKAKRPAHNRYSRLSKEWKEKIDQRAKVVAPPVTETEPVKS